MDQNRLIRQGEQHSQDIVELQETIGSLSKEHKRLMGMMEENTRVTKDVQSQVAESMELLEGIKNLLTLFRYAGAFIKWAAPIVAAVATGWVAFKSFMK